MARTEVADHIFVGQEVGKFYEWFDTNLGKGVKVVGASLGNPIQNYSLAVHGEFALLDRTLKAEGQPEAIEVFTRRGNRLDNKLRKLKGIK